MQQTLGRLEIVPLRSIWASESGDFTPWLAGETNLRLLGDAIGLDLELEAQEKNVGPFRADILCKDTANGHWVLVENQLERTDHTHLGQLLTYASGLKAVTIVWIAERFTEEHRSTLDWLNEITDESFQFFGLEIELWRIGDSPVAPKFNVVAKPNDWTRSVAEGAKGVAAGTLSESQQVALEFWQALRSRLEERGSNLRPTKPLPESWYAMSIGRSWFGLQAAVRTRDQWVGVQLVVDGPEAKPHFHLLQAQQVQIERELGFVPLWREMPEKKQSRIEARRDGSDITNRESWPDLIDWLCDKLEAFHRVFASRIRDLDSSDWLLKEEAE